MRETLCDACLVYESTADPQHACDLVQRGEPAGVTTAHVIAGPEIDHEIEVSAGERKIAHVRDLQHRADSSAFNARSRMLDQLRIHIHAGELGGGESLGEHRERDASSAAHLQHSAASRQT